MTTMKSTAMDHRAEMLSDQTKLAASLIQNLGFEGAVHACRANSWDGVLRCVLDLRSPEGSLGH